MYKILMVSIFFYANITFAQKTDTLFFKNFNDNRLQSAPANTSISYAGSINKLISGAADTLYKIDGSSCLAINPFASLYSQILLGTTDSLYQLLSIKAGPTSLYDTVQIGFELKTKAFEINPSDGFTAIIKAPATSPVKVQLSYVSAEGNTMQKTYSMFTSDSLIINPVYQNIYGSRSFSGNTPQRGNIILSTSSTSDSVFKIFMTRPGQSITRVVPNNGTEFNVSDNQLKTSLFNDFCNATPEVALCKANVRVTYLFNSSTEDFNYHSLIMDNLFLAGKYKDVETGLHADGYISKNKIVSAYTAMGNVITDIETYSGVAILVLSDGTRKKIIK